MKAIVYPLLSLILSCLFCQPLLAEGKQITAWSYYEVPPFQTSNNGSGLSQDLVALLNKKAQGQFNFSLKNIPRSRLNSYLSEEKSGIVLFVNWAWMGKTSKQDYFWSNPVMHDRNEIISAKFSAINYDGADSLIGLSFVGVRGRRYPKFASLLESGQVRLKEVNKEDLALKMVAVGRVDFTTQPRSLAIALINKLDLKKNLYFSPKPLFSFSRHIMVTSDLADVHQFLYILTKDINQSQDWKKILDKYGL